MDLMQEIIARAKANKQRIVLPEGTEERTLKAADRLVADEVADIILIGNPAEINSLAAQYGLNHIGQTTIIVRECINTHLKSNNGTALINDALQRAIDSEFIQNICTEGAEQSSVILSDETGQCLFTIQDNQVVRSFKDESFYLPLVYCKDFDRFIL